MSGGNRDGTFGLTTKGGDKIHLLRPGENKTLCGKIRGKGCIPGYDTEYFNYYNLDVQIPDKTLCKGCNNSFVSRYIDKRLRDKVSRAKRKFGGGVGKRVE